MSNSWERYPIRACTDMGLVSVNIGRLSLYGRSDSKKTKKANHSCPVTNSRKNACLELLCRVQDGQQQLHVWIKQSDWNSTTFTGALAFVSKRNAIHR